MPRKRPFVASLNEVRITRDGETAIIEYADPDVWTTHFKLGAEVQTMSDEEILERWNRGVEATEDFIAEQVYEDLTGDDLPELAAMQLQPAAPSGEPWRTEEEIAARLPKLWATYGRAT